MTTNKVVADGKSEAEVRGLVQVKANELVLRIQQGSLELKWVLKRMQDIIEGPSGFEEMVHIPLEWSADFGEASLETIEDRIAYYNKAHGGGWRLPTELELGRGLKSNKVGYRCPFWTYYWSSTPHFDGRGFHTGYKHNEGLGGISHLDMPHISQKHPRLCLCRAKKLD